MGKELIERRHRAIPPALLANKYGESASLVTFILLTCHNVVFLVVNATGKASADYISCHKFSNEITKSWEKLLAEKISALSNFAGPDESNSFCALFSPYSLTVCRACPSSVICARRGVTVGENKAQKLAL